MTAENVTLLGLYAFAGVVMYVLGRRLAGRAAGILCAVCYLMAPYLLVDLYVRHAAAEFTGMCLFPSDSTASPGMSR